LTREIEFDQRKTVLVEEKPLPAIQSRPANPWAPRIVLVVCLLVFTIKAFTSMVQESATWDESPNFGIGTYLLQTGKWDVKGSILHPPLPYYLSSIPLLFFPIDKALWKPITAQEKYPFARAAADIDRGQALLSSPENRGDHLLTLSRLMMVFVAVLLGWFVYLWAYKLYGKSGAISAIILYAFCPNILANARLVTPDIVITTFAFITLYFFWKLLKDGRIIDAAWGGIALGLALLSKYTGALIVPVCIALATIYLWKCRSLHLRNCLIFCLLGLVVLLLGYRFDLEPYFTGIAFQQQHAHKGHLGFLSGEYSTRGWWNYAFVAFVLKTPIAGMLLLVSAFFIYLWKIRKNGGFEELFLLVPVAAIFSFFTVNSQAIGLRYILPVYPFLFVFAAGATKILLSKKSLAVLYSILMAWYIGASLYIHPHYLAYFNELAGGPDNGYRYLVDSNLDWGQDLKGLGRYMREHGIRKVSLSYFGSDTPERYGIAYDWLPSYVLRNPSPGVQTTIPHDWVAISATNLQGVYFVNKDIFATLRAQKPVAKIGYSIFIYNLKN
jgi:4-amino-4-deoxy-L-arabinose transferase-like glycosyltransferase